MQELLKHYKEVKNEANPDNWMVIEGIVINGEQAYTNDYGSESVPSMWPLSQKEQLEIEALLYGYWERNIAVEDGIFFNEWLEKELNKLED